MKPISFLRLTLQFTVSFVLSIGAWSELSAQEHKNEIEKRLFIESYVDAAVSNPLMYVKHLAYFNEAITRALPNSPQTHNWNRAKQLFAMNENAKAIEAYIGKGSPIGLGIQAPTILSPSLDLKPAIVAMARRFMSLAPLSDEQILHEAVQLASDHDAVRGLGDALYKSHYRTHDYAPFNDLSSLLDELKFQPGRPPSEYFSVFGADTRALMFAQLESMAPGERANVESNWDAFGVFLRDTVWKKPTTDPKVMEQGANQILLSAGSSLLTFDFLHGSLKQEQLADEFAPFLSWWNQSRSGFGTIKLPSNEEELRSRFKKLKGDERAYDLMMNSLAEISAKLGTGDTQAVTLMRDFGKIAYSIEKIVIAGEAQDQGLDIAGSLETANAYLAIFNAVLSIWQSVTQPEPIDVEKERFMALYWNQVDILEGQRRIEREIGETQVMLASLYKLTAATEFRIRADIELLSQQVSNIRRQLNARFAATEVALRAIASQPARTAARQLRDAATGPQIDVSKTQYQAEYAAINEFALGDVSSEPFVTTIGRSWEELRNSRPADDTSVFAAIAIAAEAATFFDLTRPNSWGAIADEEKTKLSAFVEGFLSRYPQSEAPNQLALKHHSEDGFRAAMLLAADIAARVDPDIELGFEVESFRAVHEQNNGHWQQLTRALPVLLLAVERDVRHLSRVWNEQLTDAVAKNVQPDAVGQIVDFVKSHGFSSIPAFLDCLDAVDASGDTTASECTGMQEWIPTLRQPRRETKIAFLRDIDILEPEPEFKLLTLRMDPGNWGVCLQRESYCRMNCAEVVGGYPWSSSLSSRYKPETGQTADLFEGYASGVRSVCHWYPPAGGPTFEQRRPGLTKQLHDLWGRCIDGDSGCERTHKAIFEEVLWPTYFIPIIESLFWADPGKKVVDPVTDRGISIDIPVATDLSKSEAFEKPMAAYKPLLEVLVSREVARLNETVGDQVLGSERFVEALEFVEKDLWAINAMLNHLQRSCLQYSLSYLAATEPIQSDSGEINLVSERLLALVRAGRFDEVDRIISGLRSITTERPFDMLFGDEGWPECFQPSINGSAISDLLTFLEAVE